MKILCAVLLLLLGEVSSAPKKSKVKEEWDGTYPRMMFEDNFDTFDFDYWQHEITASGGGNWEFQYYTNNRSNSYVQDGVLYIKPTLTEDQHGAGFISNGVLNLWGGNPATLCTGHNWWGCERVGNADNYINPCQSARLRSVNSFSFQYGSIEIRAKMPKGDWIWPALWLLPKHNEYGDWPASGEVDLVESRGNLDLRDAPGGNLMGHQYAGQTMHWGPHWPHNGYDRTHASRNGDFGDSFHVYRIDWDENSMVFFIDDEEILNVDPGPGGFWEYGDFHLLPPSVDNPWRNGDKMAPFDKQFYIIMNVAVGGTNGFFPDDWTNAGYPKPWTNASPFAPREFWLARNNWYPTWNGEDAAMQVDYVRVSQLREYPE